MKKKAIVLAALLALSVSISSFGLVSATEISNPYATVDTSNQQGDLDDSNSATQPKDETMDNQEHKEDTLNKNPEQHLQVTPPVDSSLDNGTTKPYGGNTESEAYKFGLKEVSIPNGYYQIKAGDQVFDLHGAKYNAGANVHLFSNHSQNNQLFQFEKLDNGTYKITLVHAKLALDLNQSNNTLLQWNWHGDINQQWKILKDNHDNYYLKSAANDQLVTIKGDQLSLSPLHEQGKQQQLSLVKQGNHFSSVAVAAVPNGMYEIRSAASNKNLDVDNGLVHDGARVMQWNANSGNNQKWYVENHQDGTSTVVVSYHDKVLDLDEWRGRLAQWGRHDAINQKWKIQTNKNGTYSLISAANGQALDVSNSNKNNGDYILLWSYHGRTNQQWHFVPTEWNATNHYPTYSRNEPLDVPLIKQLPDLPTGCEATALTMLLQYRGVQIDKTTVADQMPYHPWDPEQGYVGNPYATTGWTIYPNALMGITQNYLGTAVNVTGSDLNTIIDSLNKGRPVVTWVTMHRFSVHAITITGYDDHNMYYNDPWTGEKNASINKNTFMEIWNNQNRRSLSY